MQSDVQKLTEHYRSPFPWFYPVFFCIMIAHRTQRDITKCRHKYGKAWEQYEKEVPYLFVPVSRNSSSDPSTLEYQGANQ